MLVRCGRRGNYRDLKPVPIGVDDAHTLCYAGQELRSSDTIDRRAATPYF